MNPANLYDSDDIHWLRRYDGDVEGQWVERKVSFDRRAIAEAVSGFANGQPPGGLIVVGAARDGNLPGIGADHAKADKGLVQLADVVESASWRHRFVPTADGERELLFLLVPFSGSRVVCLSDGSAYRRLGASTKKLSVDELNDLRDQRSEVPFERQRLAPYTAELLDRELAEQFAAAMRQRHNLELAAPLEECLRNRHLVTGNGGGDLTVAGALALGADPGAHLPGARLRFLRFDGVEERAGADRNVVKDRWFEGPIPRIIALFREFFRSVVRELQRVANGSFVTEPEYPEDAWHEAVVNALVHRSYSLRNACVFVRQFDDRLEVESPGGFPGGVSASNLYSNPRNPRLADALSYLDLVRLAREGTRRMIDAMAALELPPPEFEEIEGSRVRVTLRNDLGRRRKRIGVEAAETAWDGVAEQLADGYALIRGDGRQRWGALRQRGATPPQAVIDAALTQVRDIRVAEGEIAELVELLRIDRGPAVDEIALALVPQVTSGRFQGAQDVNFKLAALIANSHHAATQVLDWVETAPPADAGAEPAMLVLRDRVLRSPRPPRVWLERVVSACVRHAGSDTARWLHHRITGQALPAPPPKP